MVYKNIPLQCIQKIYKKKIIISGLQYAYLNGDSPPKSKDQNGASNDPPKEPKGARSEITLDELDDLYR